MPSIKLMFGAFRCGSEAKGQGSEEATSEGEDEEP